MLAALLLNPVVPTPGTGGWPTEQDRYRESTYDEDDPRRLQRRRRLVTIIDGPPEDIIGEQKYVGLVEQHRETEADVYPIPGSLPTGDGEPTKSATAGQGALHTAQRLGIVGQIPWSEIDDEDDLLALLIIMDEI